MVDVPLAHSVPQPHHLLPNAWDTCTSAHKPICESYYIVVGVAVGEDFRLWRLFYTQRSLLTHLASFSSTRFLLALSNFVSAMSKSSSINFLRKQIQRGHCLLISAVHHLQHMMNCHHSQFLYFSSFHCDSAEWLSSLMACASANCSSNMEKFRLRSARFFEQWLRASKCRKENGH